ncbi:MAG TPA: MFS transporter [Gemmatimonadales bacterium]|nr:MFS transporter [Gemmatimonadales bacterium]
MAEKIGVIVRADSGPGLLHHSAGRRAAACGHGDGHRRHRQGLGGPAQAETVLTAVTAKITRRLIPYLFLCYIVNYLDRFNISFAALEMKADLGLGDAVYGLGAGMFFVGYVTFEIPSNLILQRLGARWWLARIMVTWGALSCCMMFVRTPVSFYVLRFLLGLAEAGFLPGMIFYLTHWIPARDRAGVFALFLTSTALAGVVGGPVSAALLTLRGLGGLAGWQWLFLVEGLPAVLLGVTTLFYLPDHPAEARWLSEPEQAWLEDTLRAERRALEQTHRLTLWQALTHGRVWRLCLLYFSTIIGFYGVAFWLPQIVQSFSGLSNAETSLISALPYLAASVGMVLIARHADRTGEKRRHVAFPAFAAAAGLVLGALVQRYPVAAFLALCLSATGIWSTLGPFWSLPTTFLTGTAAAGGIALINSVGNIGGFVGPTVVGLLRERTHRFESGLLVLAAALLVAGALALSLREDSRPGGGGS